MNRLNELNILFLEDNLEFAKNTIELLNMYFQNVFHSPTIRQALELFEDKKIDVIFSDIKVQDGNGLDFIKKIRELDEQIPIVILSAHKDEDFLFKAIPLNIISYELKPLSFNDFLILFSKLVKKFQPDNIAGLGKGLEYNFDKKILTENDREVILTKKEIYFLELAIKNKNKVITNEMVQKFVWEDKVMSDSAIKNLVFRLRKKVATDFLLTIQGIGYKIMDDNNS